METNDVITLLIALVGTLGGASAWQYYQKRLEIKASSDESENKQRHIYRDDLRERVAVLETRLEESRASRDELLEQIRALSEETSALRVEVQFLREERDSLQQTIHRLTEQLEKRNQPHETSER